MLLNILNKYPLMDVTNIYKIIEDMIYKDVEEYYKDRTLKCKYTLRFGLREGDYKLWYENGQKRVECYCINDRLDGLYQRWYENGQKKDRKSLSRF